MIYFKRNSFIETWLLLYFSIFNLYWIDQTYVYLGIIQKTYFGISLNAGIGFLLIFYVLNRTIGFKKKNIKQKKSSSVQDTNVEVKND